MSNKSVVIPGGGLCSLLTVLFVGLKLTGHISWSWWWVLSPILILWGILGMMLITVVLIAAAVAAWR